MGLFERVPPGTSCRLVKMIIKIVKTQSSVQQGSQVDGGIHWVGMGLFERVSP